MKLTKNYLKKLITEVVEQGGNKKIYVLVGPPSVGKSTWIKNTFQQERPYVINRDDIVEKVASTYGWTYDDMFMMPPAGSSEGETSEKYGTVVKSPAYMTWAPLSYDKVLEANNSVQTQFTSRVSGAKGQNNIVIDMTNMNAAARKGALKAIEGAEHEYHKVAVVFNFQGAEDIIKKVAAKRAAEAQAAGKSKTIPDAAFDRMFKSFQQVDQASEGFDEVVSVDNTSALKKLVPQQAPVSEGLKNKIRKVIEEVLIKENLHVKYGLPNKFSTEELIAVMEKFAKEGRNDPDAEKKSRELEQIALSRLKKSGSETPDVREKLRDALEAVLMAGGRSRDAQHYASKRSRSDAYRNQASDAVASQQASSIRYGSTGGWN